MIQKHVGVIMSKDRRFILKGKRYRMLIPTDDTKDRKQVIMYSSKGKANAALQEMEIMNLDILPEYQQLRHTQTPYITVRQDNLALLEAVDFELVLRETKNT